MPILNFFKPDVLLNIFIFTSPIKYFEYERGGVKICSTNVPAHKNLPLQDNIYYFEKNNLESFVTYY